MKALWDNARYPIIKNELLYGTLCLKKKKKIPHEIVLIILEYVTKSTVKSKTCECDLDRCHWCVYEHTDSIGGPLRLPFHKQCHYCVKRTHSYKG